MLTDVDVATRTAKFEVQDAVKADVLNVVPPQRAGAIARAAGVVTANDRWCDVDFLTFESVKVKNVHVLGDAIQIATGMPKSGHMANQHAKVCAAAVVALLAGQAPNPTPVLTNTCYSFITDKDVVHVCLGPPVRQGEEDGAARAGLGRRVAGDERDRGPVRVQLGEEHLGGHARVGDEATRRRRSLSRQTRNKNGAIGAVFVASRASRR